MSLFSLKPKKKWLESQTSHFFLGFNEKSMKPKKTFKIKRAKPMIFIVIPPSITRNVATHRSRPNHRTCAVCMESYSLVIVLQQATDTATHLTCCVWIQYECFFLYFLFSFHSKLKTKINSCVWSERPHPKRSVNILFVKMSMNCTVFTWVGVLFCIFN